jgi:hypothetical protein
MFWGHQGDWEPMNASHVALLIINGPKGHNHKLSSGAFNHDCRE